MKEFFWGAATSSHQVEGGNKNDWTEWELANAERLAREAEQKRKNPAFSNIVLESVSKYNYISGNACDHYHRFRDDFDIAKSLGHNAHRFSIEWSRVEPEEGKFDEREIEHYRQVIAALRERGLEPFVTLWHWTLPLWFRDRGGWAWKESPKYFARYVEKVVSSFKPRRPTSRLDVGRLVVRFWITLNEINVYTGHGYWNGSWPPSQRSLYKYLIANRHLSQAHIAAYKIIKSIEPRSEIGVAHGMIYFTRFPAGLKNYIYNHFFLRSIEKYQDFIGVNYYFSDRDTKEKSDMDWSIDPEGFYHVLRGAARYKKPIYVTENGIADSKDEKRAKFIQDHIVAMKKAMREDIDVRGYFHWSLLDNFEWDKGFAPRFGLVEVDYKTVERHVRPSALEYKKIIEK